jgi:DNA-binding HxlR family transcriptional regulator
METNTKEGGPTYWYEDGVRCHAAPLFQLLAGKWVLPVLYELHHAARPLRFGEVRAAVGAITTSELTKALRLLADLRLVERVQYPEIPPRVEYACTPLGNSLRPHLDGLAGWLREHGKELRGAASARAGNGP